MDGLVLQAKYSFMPNKLGGCGIQNRTDSLLAYAAEEVSDRGLEEILKTFEIAYPYIEFIARECNIRNPFDKKVVEAYWIGNDLLGKIDRVNFYRWCHDRYKKKTDPKALKILVGKVPMGALPHHSFHVFNSYIRGHNFSPVIKYINECRIASGKVLKVENKEVEVSFNEIIQGIKGIELSAPKKRKVMTKIKGKSFVPELKKGDYVTFHWGWVCEKINATQAKTLEMYTKNQLKLFNQV